MRRWTIIWSFLIILTVGIVGCKETGYEIRIETSQISYSELDTIEEILKQKGFIVVTYQTEDGDKKEWREKEEGLRYPGDVSTLLKKELMNKPSYWVHVQINYVKGTSNNTSDNLLIRIINEYDGLIIPEIKVEIDNIGDMVYKELVNMVGEGKVKIERKVVSPPAFY